MPAEKSTRPAHAVCVFAGYLRDAQVERKWNKGRDSVPVCQRCGKSGHFLQVFPAPRPRIQSFFFKRAWRPAGMPRNGSAEADEACDAEGLLAGWDA
jgi:hypothetical protein